jgi:protein-disulfide isomerase
MARRVRAGVGLLFAGCAFSGVVGAQQPTTEDLKKDIEALRETLRAIQKDVQDIKAMVSRQAPPPSGIGVVLDVGSNPVKGERTAKLTLVEFSDYQ